MEIDIRRKYNVNIIATKKNGKINAVVTADTILSGDETLLVLGEYFNYKTINLDVTDYVKKDFINFYRYIPFGNYVYRFGFLRKSD